MGDPLNSRIRGREFNGVAQQIPASQDIYRDASLGQTAGSFELSDFIPRAGDRREGGLLRSSVILIASIRCNE